jgi:hypothetical protein
MSIQGSCACNTVKFEVDSTHLKAYKCHCSLCKKITGSEFSKTTLVNTTKFKWICGEKSILSFSKASGYTQAFCKKCSASVPNVFRGMPYYSIPIGCIESRATISVVAELFVSQKVNDCHKEAIGIVLFDDEPELAEILSLLGVK